MSKMNMAERADGQNALNGAEPMITAGFVRVVVQMNGGSAQEADNVVAAVDEHGRKDAHGDTPIKVSTVIRTLADWVITWG